MKTATPKEWPFVILSLVRSCPGKTRLLGRHLVNGAVNSTDHFIAIRRF